MSWLAYFGITAVFVAASVVCLLNGHSTAALLFGLVSVLAIPTTNRSSK